MWGCCGGQHQRCYKFQMLNSSLFALLNEWLSNRPLFYPTVVLLKFPDGYVPVHKKCYRTACKVSNWKGYSIVAGIRFLEKAGKLYPWPHMVNAVSSTICDGLIDASPAVNEPDLGFVPIRSNETSAWNEITKAYDKLFQHVDSPEWNDPFADTLTARHLVSLRNKADCARWQSASIAVPIGIPEEE